ncbi:DMT family transporter [Niameybacter massiliensis]|uniref:DMT family transporter n=1 Tax=Niameybacter massiliensis TaxID=1658108 RepID=UPI00241F9184|nr:DMT family transporter [Niameybacter massiliensis]
MASIVAIISGLLMSIQGVFNTRVNEKAGLWFTNAIVNAIGLLTSLIVLAFVRDADLSGLKSVNKFYLLGGVLGAGIVYTVILSISKMGPAGATMLILIAQLVGSYLIELLGWFGTEKTDFQWTKVLAVGIIIVGIVLFKWKK